LVYNGVLQIDIDFKVPGGDKLAAALLERVKRGNIPGVLLCGFSPSTFGVKILVQSDNTDKERHPAALKHAVSFFSEVLEVDQEHFDTLGASQPCYLFLERTPGTMYYNPNAAPLHIPETAYIDTKSKDTHNPDISDTELETIKQAANYLITNGCNVAGCYDEYLRVMLAVKRTFGPDGEGIALEILNNCPTFHGSTTQSTFSTRFSNLKTTGYNGRQITGRTIFALAHKNGFIPTATAHRIFNTNKGEHLTTMFERLNVDLNDVLGKYIVSPTGTGKTALAAKLSTLPGRKVVLIVPGIAQIKQIAKREGATPFFGGVRDIPKECRFVVTTIQSFNSAFITRVNLKEWSVIFDEAHGFTTDASAGYKLKDLRKFLYLREYLGFEVTYLTGTDIYNFNPYFEGLERWEVRQPGRAEKSLYIQRCTNITATAAAILKDSVQAGRSPVILLNDKSVKLKTLETALKGYKIAVLNSKQKESDDFKQITENRMLPDGVEGIITTVVIKEGNDILDTKNFDFILIGPHHSTTIEQISARARKANDISVYILKGKKTEKDIKGFNPAKYAALVCDQAQRFCNERNTTEPTDDTAALFYEREVRQAAQQIAAYVPNGTRWEVCPLLVNNCTYTAETWQQYANDELQKKALEKYGFVFREGIDDTPTDQHTEATKQQIKAVCSDFKADQEKEYNDDLTAIEQSLTPAQLVKAATDKRIVHTAFKHVSDLLANFRLTEKEAASLLKQEQINGRGKPFHLLKNKMRVQCLRTNSDYMKSGRILSLIVLKLDRSFKQGVSYTAEEIREKLRAALFLDRSLNLGLLFPESDPKQANRKALDILRMFLNVTDSGKKRGGDGNRNRVFIIEKYSSFSSTKKHKYSEKTEKETTLADLII
jgi:hypothetical protein